MILFSVYLFYVTSRVYVIHLYMLIIFQSLWHNTVPHPYPASTSARIAATGYQMNDRLTTHPLQVTTMLALKAL